MIRFLCVIGVFILGLATPAFADPCEGTLPSRAGAEVSGVVQYVADGDGLCVGAANSPTSTWIEVRLADFNAPELSSQQGPAAKALLERVASGRHVVCVATPGRNGRVRSYDRVITVCRIGGRQIGDLLRPQGGIEGGN